MVEQSTYRWVTVGILALVLVLISAVLVINGGFGVDPSSSARSTVEAFGAQMQTVSLLDANAARTMASAYGALVTDDLLQRWQRDPEHAPGRLASSPYPDRIEIVSITKQGSGYVVQGEIVLMSSTGEADREPVVLFVVPEAGSWKIAVYEEQKRHEE